MSEALQSTPLPVAVARAPRRIPAVVWFFLPPGLTLLATLIAVVGLIVARLADAHGAYVAFGEVLTVCLWILAGIAAFACTVGLWHCVLAFRKWLRTGLAPWQHPE